MDLSKVIKLESSKDSVPIDNHFKLYAGPGAGKTTFLTNHINRILEHSHKISKAKKVACITYTNIGVETLQNRLANSYEDVEITTIHSFLYKHVVKPYLWMLENCPFPVESLDGHNEIILSRSLLQEFKSRSKSYFEERLNSDLSNALSNLTWSLEEDSLKLKFLKVYQGKVGKYSIKKSDYMIYKKLCWENGLLSHDDVLYFSYTLLKKNDEIKRVLRAKFPYILLDEFQDTSPLQAEIIKMIAEKETIVGVIGDPCQAIFSFQGTDEKLFDTFNLDGIKCYYLKNNHRSTDQIISLLNHVRAGRDFDQYGPEEKRGQVPILLIGNSFAAHKYVSSNCKEFCTLAYKNNETKALKFDLEFTNKKEIDLTFKDGNRGWMIHFIIHAIEYAKQMKIKEAIKFMRKAYRKSSGFTDKEAFSHLKRLLNSYEDYSEGNLKDFYNNHIYNHLGIKGKISRNEINTYYEQRLYKNIAIEVKVIDDTSLYKTIHKSKGDEFDNVLVILPNDDENKNLEFLLSPDLGNETHRVYYVALSRAKEKLYINLPNISDSTLKKLEILKLRHIKLLND